MHNLPEAYFCRLTFEPKSNRPYLETLFKDNLGDIGHPDAPVGREFESYAYLRDPGSLSHFSNFQYQEDMVIQLRGSFRYTDDRQNVYHTPWCYQTFQPYKTAKPG